MASHPSATAVTAGSRGVVATVTTVTAGACLTAIATRGLAPAGPRVLLTAGAYSAVATLAGGRCSGCVAARAAASGLRRWFADTALAAGARRSDDADGNCAARGSALAAGAAVNGVAAVAAGRRRACTGAVASIAGGYAGTVAAATALAALTAGAAAAAVGADRARVTTATAVAPVSRDGRNDQEHERTERHDHQSQALSHRYDPPKRIDVVPVTLPIQKDS
jgi:hypothetical protein